MTADPVADWLKALGTLTAVNSSVQEAQAKLRAYLPLIRQEFPRAAFTAASLAHVARNCKFFPTYGELAIALGAWWHENRPAPTNRLPPPPDSCPLDADGRPHPDAPRHLTDAWYRNNWDNADGVRHLTRRCLNEAPHLLGMLHDAVTRWAPQHSHLVPDIAAPPATPRPEEERPKAYHLTPQQLDELKPLPGGLKRAP